MKHEEPIDEPPLFWNGDLEVNGNKLDVLSHQIIKRMMLLGLVCLRREFQTKRWMKR